MNKSIEDFQKELDDALRSGNNRLALRNFCKKCSDDQLVHLLDEVVPQTLKEVILEEISLRKHREELAALKEPKIHWSVTPGFWVGFAAMVFAGIAAFPVVYSWFQVSLPASKDSNSLQPQSSLDPTTPAILQTNLPTNIWEPEKEKK